MKICDTYKLIPKEEIDRVFTESDTAEAEMDSSCLCFESVYKKVAEHCDENTVILDFGCAYAPQAYWFTKCKKYIGIDLPFGNNVVFKTENSDFYFMSGQAFIMYELPTLNLDEEHVIAICSYVPDTELQEIVSKRFKYNYVQYCNRIISNKLPRKDKA